MKALLNVRFCHRPWLISAYAYQPVFVLAPYCLTQILSIAAYDHAPPGWPELLVRGLASFVRRFKAACLLFIYGVMRLIEAALALSATRLSIHVILVSSRAPPMEIQELVQDIRIPGSRHSHDMAPLK
jgi:hypothetical protein